MYADDLILLAISRSDLQDLVDLCRIEFNLIGMDFNVLKSACIRVGPRFESVVFPITINDQSLPWLKEIKYLGLVVVSAKKFTTNLQSFRQKFFSSLNGIFGKVGTNTSPEVLCSLVQAFCLPVLLYAAEALNYSERLLCSLEKSYSQAFFKIFKTFDKQVIRSCQFFMGILPIKLLISQRKLNYLSKLRIINVPLFYVLCRNDEERIGECSKYCFPTSELMCSTRWNKLIWDFFALSMTDG